MSKVIDSLLSYKGETPSKPPLLVLGQFERVGSTFYCDQLEKTHLIHNEPFKLLVPSHWPIARDFRGNSISIDEFFDNPDIPSVNKHWLRNFTVSMHYPGDQVIKETNLYLALPQFLDLFPYSEIELLTRNPLGIVSSFKRNDLYHRWHYDEVAETLLIQLDASKPEDYESLQYMLRQGDTWQSKLVWMIGLNAILLSRHVDPKRVKKVITYEDDIIPLSTPETISHERVQDSIFGTNIYKSSDDFEIRFTPDEMRRLTGAMADCVKFVQKTFDAKKLYWFDQLYARHLKREYRGKAVDTKEIQGNVSAATSSQPQAIIASQPKYFSHVKRNLAQWHEDIPLLWDYSLTTNKQMGNFLQSMIENGQDPSLNYLLLLDNMPPSRGGRLSFNDEKCAYMITDGFSDHPAYWISWLAATLYAYKEGMRLPSHAEWQKVYDDKYNVEEHPNANHTYAYDDVVPTGIKGGSLPDDFFGNLKIWCSDWSNEQAVSKKLAGISWKHYFHKNYVTKTERPYLTNARWIGTRLVCCSECAAPTPRSMKEVMDKFNQVIVLMRTTSIKTVDDLSDLNEKIDQVISPKACAHQKLV